ncbi:MAG: hypothetical protein GWO07_10240 [Candidatus Dadabacteria bacterium]|nr:hypothetical protein [Candidatus Dadabacteria bacterium]NIS09124.1 hypothetical protein [Candidatus Dadabacteria bacterium]NIV41557.1 hypothetical protein [Candidatus Dadabacteria bacterium]NIX15701.1 hypothetical protein [Candidatus Dadabacteria bacterium]NIY22432.1 hypothetical protein [Candidatus Dadabacteria bacterium]
MGKDKKTESGQAARLSALDFTFVDILQNIEEMVSELYWAHTGIIYSFPESLTQEQYERVKRELEEYLLHEDKARSRHYMHRGFIENFGQYIFSDWIELAGYDDIEKLKTFDPTDSSVVEENAVVFIRCVDAAFWVVYANNQEIINILENSFKFTETISL